MIKGETVHILLVEDDDAHANVIQRALASWDTPSSVTVATTLRQGRSCLAKSPPDLLITDLVLPDGKGTELLSTAKQSPSFPAIVMTAHGDEQAAVKAMKEGALDYVVKSEDVLLSIPHIVARALREWECHIGREQAEKELREAHADLEQVFNAAAPLCVIDKDYNLLRVNNTFCSLLALQAQEIVGKKCYDVWQEPHCHTTECPMRQIAGGKEHAEHELEKVLSDGRAVCCVVAALPYRSVDGELIGIVTSVADITQRKRASQQLRRLNEELEERVRLRTAELEKAHKKLLESAATCRNRHDRRGRRT